MKVKCICNYEREKELTLGKKYCVQGSSNSMYVLKSDTGEVIKTLKERFEIVK